MQYATEDIRDFAQKCLESYKKNQTVPLSYNEFRANAMNIMYNSPKSNKVQRIENNTHIAIAPSTMEMLKILGDNAKRLEDIQLNAPPEKRDYMITQLCKELFKPQLEFDYTPPCPDVEYNGIVKPTPMWFNTTMKGINIRLGYDKGDSALPSSIELGDDVVHMMLGGATGAGKSVALNTVICNLLVEYPPWELDIYLGDFKKVEGARYANRMSTPHMKIVAATGSTEFILSLYRELIKEMNDRQALFVKVGVQKIEDFRKKFGLVMPRVLLIVDEFTQMYENIKASESAGNDSAADDKRAVDSALSDIARLGRSMGIHMCLSSQQLDNLDSGVANQFKAGATLKAPPAVSNSLIGNDAGASIRGKGKGYYNCNKAAKSYKDNVLVRIPFLNSEQSEADAAAGKLTNLHEILKCAVDNAEALHYSKGLVFYDEDAPIPAQKYLNAIDWCKEQLKKKRASNDLDDRVFCKQTIAYLPMGPEIKLSPDPVVPLVIKCAKNNSVVIHGTDPLERNYIVELMAASLQNMYDDVATYVVRGSESIVLGCKLDQIPNAVIKTRAAVPPEVMAKMTTRKILIEMQARFDDAQTEWSDDIMWDYVAELSPKLWKMCGIDKVTLSGYCRTMHNTGNFPEFDQSLGVERINAIKEICNTFVSYEIPFKQLRKGGPITVHRFNMIVVWLAGVDNFINVDSSDIKNQIRYLMEIGPTTKVLPIALAETWSKVGSIFEHTNFILEQCDKTFFMDIGLPKAVNCNKNSFQIHDRLLKQRFIVSKYSALKVE